MAVGVGFTPFETRADLVVRLAQQADGLGLEQVGVAEGWTHDAPVLLAELALRTTRIGLGTAIVSAWSRTPASIALGAAGLQRCSGGRFTLGVGASSPPLTEGLHGMAWDRPLARLRRTVIEVRALLAGERLPHPVPGARPLRLGVLPDPPVPVVLAALAPGAVRLAGELADGWAPFLWSRARVADGRALLAEGAARADEPSPTRILAGVPVALGPDERHARRLAAWWLATYLTRMGPLYPAMLGERFGMKRGVDAVVAAAGDGPPDDLPAAAEELAREVTLMATYDEAGGAIAAWRAAGADRVDLVLPPGRPEDELAEVLRAAVREAAAPVPGGAA